MAKETRTIKDLEIFAVGTWNGDTYSAEDLKDIITAAQHVGFEPPLKLGHMEDEDTKVLLKKEGLPAFGWIKNLRLKGTKLIADITDIPKKLAELIERKAYKRVSAEIFWNFKKGADTYRRVLKAVSLLGAEIPAITDLKGIDALYSHFHLEPKAYDEANNEYRTYFYPDQAVAPGGLQLKMKDTVKYRLAEGTMERCGSCRFYTGSSEAMSIGGCNLVHGEIAADGICDLYEAREAYYFPGGAGAIEDTATTSKKMPKYNIEKRGDEWCVVDGDKVRCYPTEEEAKEKEMALSGMGDKRKRNYIIEKRGDEWCLIAKGSGKTLGCHPTEEEAQAQERAVQANKSVTIVTLDQVRKLCAPCAERMEYANIKELKLSYANLSPEIFQGDPDAICGALWAHGTEEQRGGFGDGPEDRGAGDTPPKAWWDDCTAKVSKSSLIEGDIHATAVAQRGQGSTDMTLEQKVQELEGKVGKLTQENTELKTKNERLEKENKDAQTYSAMILDQKTEIEKLQEQLNGVVRTQKEEKIRVFVDAQIRAGKVLPREKVALVAMLREASEEVKLVYAENGKEVKLSQRQLIEQNIKSRPKFVDFGERTVSTTTLEEGGEEGTESGDVRTEVHDKVKKFQAEHNEPDYKKAQDRVLQADPKLKDRYAESSGWTRAQQ